MALSRLSRASVRVGVARSSAAASPRTSPLVSRSPLVAVSHSANTTSHTFELSGLVSKRFYAAKTIPFLLADIGEGISEVEVLQWYVKEGAQVEQFTPLCEVQSDKATVPISSRYRGTVRTLRYKVGEMAKVGSPLCDIEVDDATAAAAAAQGHGGHHAPAPAAAPAAAPSAPAATADEHEEVTQEITTSRGKRVVLAAPAVRFLAKQHKVDLNQVKGNGRDGRVTKGDLLAYVANPPSSTPSPVKIAAAPTPSATATTPAPKAGKAAVLPQELTQDVVVPLRGFARAMVSSMTQSLTIPHLGLSDEIDMSRLVAARESLKPLASSRGIKLTYMPFILKAASLAMKSYPLINSKLNPNNTEVTLIAAHNIAIAVDTPSGLVVPNVKNCERRSLMEIAHELQRVITLAQTNKLLPEDLQGSTFSISNIGAIAGTYASPVLVVPQVAIGAVGKIQKLPRYDAAGNVVPQHIMVVSWSADHRVIDGGTIANFSNLFKQYLEEPTAMLFDLK